MELGIFDKAVDILLERQKLVRGELARRFRKEKPFRMEPVPPREQIMNYMDYVDNPDIEQEFIDKGADPMTIQKYHDNMQNLIRRYQKNG